MINRDDLLALGKIRGVHGLRGDLMFLSYSGEMDSFAPGVAVFIGTPDGKLESITVRKAKPHKKGFLVGFAGLDHINKVEKLVGSELFINKVDLPDLDDGTYYWHELVGLEVITTEDEEYLGKITQVMETGSNDVYVVQDGKKEILIPALEWVILDVDLTTGRMIVDLPEGL